MEIGVWRIMRRKGSVLYHVSVLGDFSHLLVAQDIRLGLCSHVCRAKLLRVDIINAAIANVERSVVAGLFSVVLIGVLIGVRRCWFITVDPYVASQIYLMCA